MLLAGSGTTGFGIVLLVIFILAVYFIPTIIAMVRKVPNTGSVAIINIFLGWTFIGWVVAMSMAARTAPSAYR